MTTVNNLRRAPERAGPREWAALVVLMLPVLLVSIDNTVLSFALPAVSVALQPSGTQLLWIVDIYALMLAGLLIAMGSLGDRLGRRRLLLIGAAGFGAASILAAYSNSPETLIAGRALLGVFGATLMPSTLSMIRNIFVNREQRRLAIATWAAMFSGGAALGPIVGGWLLEHYWWGSVFLINVPIIVLLIGLALMVVPESRDPNPGPVDIVSIALSMAAMLPFVFGIKQLVEHGLTDLTLTSFAVGIVSGVAFVRRQRRLPNPMVDLDLFGNRVFNGAIVSNLLSLMGFAGFVFFGAQFLQLVVGMSPLAAAMVLVPGLAATIVAGFVAVRLVEFVPANLLVSGSFVLSAMGYAIVVFVGETPTMWSVGAAFAVLGIGIGLAETLTNDLMLSSVPAHKAGSASAISETAYEVGAVLGTAILGSILTISYREHLHIPAAVQERSAEGAFETLGGAVEAASHYPNVIGERLLHSAHFAFDVGVQNTAAAGIAIALLAAVVAYRSLRD